MSDDIYQRVAGVFRTMLTEEQMGALNAEATMDDVDGWDSLNFLDMIMGLEATFGIRIDGLDAANLTSIPNIIEYVRSNT
jgi:acyl carrier protein